MYFVWSILPPLAKKRIIVLTRFATTATGGQGAMIPLGTFAEVVAAVARFNVAPDTSGPKGFGSAPGMAVLFGPGFIMEVPGDASPRDDVNQVMTTVTDEDFAWPVLSRMCKSLGWRMMDAESGRTFG